MSVGDDHHALNDAADWLWYGGGPPGRPMLRWLKYQAWLIGLAIIMVGIFPPPPPEGPPPFHGYLFLALLAGWGVVVASALLLYPFRTGRSQRWKPQAREV